MSVHHSPIPSPSSWSRFAEMLRRNAVVIVGIVVLAVIVLILAPLPVANSSADEYIAQIDARTAAYEAEFESVYGATNANYDGKTFYMTVGDQSYKCEAPEKGTLSKGADLRCETLTIVKATGSR